MARQRPPMQTTSLLLRWTRTRRPGGPQKGSLSSTKNTTASFHAPDMVATRLCLPPSSRERQVGVTEGGEIEKRRTAKELRLYICTRARARVLSLPPSLPPSLPLSLSPSLLLSRAHITVQSSLLCFLPTRKIYCK